MESKEAMYYEVGSYRAEITPPLSIPYLAGYPRHQFFSGVHDPLYVSAVVVAAGGNQAALVTIDGIGINNEVLGKDRDFTAELKERIEKATGIKKESVIILSGHIHSTPDTLNFRDLCQNPAAQPWLYTLMEQVVSALSIASRNKFKACLKIGKGKLDGISINRRGGECLDTELIMLLFESPEKDRNIIMVNYACHPVIVQVQELVSADYVGAMRDIVKKSLNHIDGILFIQGACGDINPARGWTCDFRDVYLTGAAIAGEVMKVYSAMAVPGYPEEPVIVGSITEFMELPSRPLPSPEESGRLNDDLEELRLRYQVAQSENEKDDIRMQMGPLEEVLRRIYEGSGPYKAEIQMIRLGNGVFTGVPGEPLCKMGLEIKEMFKPIVSIPAGYANGYLGYIASPEDWQKGGYEVELGPWSKVGQQSYNMVLDRIRSLRKALLSL